MPSEQSTLQLNAPAISKNSFERIAQFINLELGIKMPASKISMIQSRLMRRLRELNLDSIDQYCDHLFESPAGGAERIHLINALTTNKTDFFRESQHFDYLTKTALPQLEHGGALEPGKRLNVWSAACSSGEEPYTLAMVLSEYAAAHPSFTFRILATDVSTKVLQNAKEAIYSRQQIEPVPRTLRAKYLLRGKHGHNSLVRVAPALRRLVSFHKLNFMDQDYRVPDMFHIVFCRNVLIYFDRSTQEAVIGKLCRNLVSGGYLFVSHSESLSGLNLPLVALGSSCFRKK